MFIYVFSFLPVKQFKPLRTNNRKEKISHHPSKRWFRNGTCLIWSVFISVQKTCDKTLVKNVLCHYDNQQSGCRDTRLHKAAAQPEHSRYEGKSFNKVFPMSLGELKEMVKFVPTNTVIWNVQKNDWYMPRHSSGEMLRRHFSVNRAPDETVTCFKSPRLSVATYSNKGEFI